MRVCGGRNVFAALPPLVPTVGAEAVIAADPQVIIGAGADATRPPWLDDWKRWPKIAAVKQGNLFFIQPDLITRLSPRVLDGVEMLCQELDQARSSANPNYGLRERTSPCRLGDPVHRMAVDAREVLRRQHLPTGPALTPPAPSSSSAWVAWRAARLMSCKAATTRRPSSASARSR